ncbi:MAG: WhiB family transcriptional regulator [Actinomycetota bacterium]|nr:WhiB family transcriptional regulator [Actinomycetota bacterium]
MTAGIRVGRDRSDDLDGHAALPQRTPWHQAAFCHGAGTTSWFPTRGEASTNERTLCRSCPVRAECLAACVEAGNHSGV